MKIKPFKIFDSLKTDRWVTLNKEYEVVSCHNHYVFYDDQGSLKLFQILLMLTVVTCGV